MSIKQVVNVVKSNPRKIQATLVAAVLISTVVAVAAPHVTFAGSPSTTTPDNGTQNQEQTLTEQNQATLDRNQPAPTFTYSTERANLIKRLNLTANPNLTGYIYLMGANGQVVANYTVKGKVTSLNSLLTTPQQLQSGGCGNGGCTVTTGSPDMDGSYGPNPSGVFFFTTSGSYVEWSGPYLYSNQPLNITSAVTLVAPAQ